MQPFVAKISNLTYSPFVERCLAWTPGIGGHSLLEYAFLRIEGIRLLRRLLDLPQSKFAIAEQSKIISAVCRLPSAEPEVCLAKGHYEIFVSNEPVSVKIIRFDQLRNYARNELLYFLVFLATTSPERDDHELIFHVLKTSVDKWMIEDLTKIGETNLFRIRKSSLSIGSLSPPPVNPSLN